MGDDESYRLRVNGTLELEAESEWGVLRGLETALQLIEPGGSEFRIPCCSIEDAPRFPWRGLMLDVARHFIPCDAILRTLEGMAALKLNVLHLHLSDDQAFRLQSRAHPALAAAHALSADDVGRIVAFASDLGIRVVAELDMPGHVTSWLERYPWLAAEEADYRAPAAFGIQRSALDPTRDEVYDFLRDLLAEVAAHFPDRCVHVGGDEVHRDAWVNARIRKFMRAHEIADAPALQCYFNARVASLLRELDRAPIGWDEILHPDLHGDWLVQCWRHPAHRDRAQHAGYDCIYSAGYYLDLNLPAGWHYRVDPEAPEDLLEALDREMWSMPGLEGLKAALGSLAQAQSRGEALPRSDADGRVLGGEACMWSELVTEELLDRRVFSRLPAIAERLWSPRDVTDVKSMYARLPDVWTFLARTTAVDLETSGMRLLARFGDAKRVRDFAELLEPVKWYRRHIGDEAIRARAEGRRVSARPYDASTPLERLVDALLPESLQAHALRELIDAYVAAPSESVAAALRAHAASWRRIAAQLDAPAEVGDFAALLPQLADLLEGALEGALPLEAQDVLARAGAVHGECTLAIAAPLARLFGRPA